MTENAAFGTLARHVWLAVLAGFVATASAAQQASPAFKAGVDTVRLDARVVDATGAFVAGLTKDDFQIVEDGQQQTITAFSMVQLGPPAIAAEAAPPADVSANASFKDGRVYLLVLDDLQVDELRSATVRELARRFIDRSTSPADRIAIATTSGLAAGTQDFTNDRMLLLQSVARFKADVPPEAVRSDMPQSAVARAGNAADPVAAARLPLQSLRSSVAWLATVPDRRKALVLIGEGMPDGTSDPEVEGTIREIVATSVRANVAIYSVDADGLPASGMKLLADETGGASVTNSNDVDALFARVVSDSSAYYLLGYTSTNKRSKEANQPGQPLRQLDVRVSRPELTVQARRGYQEPWAATTKRPAIPKGLPADINTTFQSPVPITGIDLAVTSAAVRGDGRGKRAAVAIIIEGRGNQPTEVFVGAAQDGKMQAIERGMLNPAKGRNDDVMQATAKLDLKPGRYRLRVAGQQESTGAQGSVLHDFEVPDFSAEGLSISSLALIDPVRARAPTTRRTFGPGESVDVAGEVYWKRGMNDPISVAVIVTNPGGDEVYRQDGIVPPAKWPKQGVDVGTTIGFEGWPPGSYSLTVEAKTAGLKPLAAKRAIMFVVAAR